MADDEKKNPFEIELEVPPAPETPVGHFEQEGQLFSPDDDGLALLNARFTIADSCFRLLTTNTTFKDFSRDLLLAIMKVVKCEAGSIFEVDHSNKTLFFRAVVGQSSDGLTKFTIPMGQGIVGHVAESRQPLVVDNAGENKLHLKAVADAVGFETRNVIALPIVIRGQIYGVLELLNRVGESNFTAGDVEVLNYFCEMAARAIEVRFMLAWANQMRAISKEASVTAKAGNKDQGKKGSAA